MEIYLYDTRVCCVVVKIFGNKNSFDSYSIYTAELE